MEIKLVRTKGALGKNKRSPTQTIRIYETDVSLLKKIGANLGKHKMKDIIRIFVNRYHAEFIESNEILSAVKILQEVKNL